MATPQSDRTSSVGRAIDGVLWVVMLSHVAVAIHEAAHVLVALLCGGCVPLVRVGEGRLLFSTTFKWSRIEVRAIPMSGFAAHTIENNRPYAYIAICLAGPTASFAWLMLLVSLWTPILLPSIVFAIVATVTGGDGDFASASRKVLRILKLRSLGLLVRHRNTRPVYLARRRSRRESAARWCGRRIIASW